ncbi:MAG: hypothetical protein ACM3Q1_01970, partial [Bacteroidales bacterium]
MTVNPGRARAGQTRHFLDLDRFDTETLRRILDLGAAYKRTVICFRQKQESRLLAFYHWNTSFKAAFFINISGSPDETNYPVLFYPFLFCCFFST